MLKDNISYFTLNRVRRFSDPGPSDLTILFFQISRKKSGRSSPDLYPSIQPCRPGKRGANMHHPEPHQATCLVPMWMRTRASSPLIWAGGCGSLRAGAYWNLKAPLENKGTPDTCLQCEGVYKQNKAAGSCHFVCSLNIFLCNCQACFKHY